MDAFVFDPGGPDGFSFLASCVHGWCLWLVCKAVLHFGDELHTCCFSFRQQASVSYPGVSWAARST